MSDDGRTDPRGRKKVQVRTNRGRKTSSKRWLDRQLNEHGYILPGLGDAGDRLYGTK